METTELNQTTNQQNKYYLKFKNSHDVNQKIQCSICGGSYSYFNKSSHCKTKKHLNMIEIINKIKNENVSEE